MTWATIYVDFNYIFIMVDLESALIGESTVRFHFIIILTHEVIKLLFKHHSINPLKNSKSQKKKDCNSKVTLSFYSIVQIQIMNQKKHFLI